jgi:hypothetical protein
MRKNRKNIKVLAILLIGMIFVGSCVGDLDTVPLDKDLLVSENVYNDFNNYESILAKCYAGLALSGQQGPAGKADISGIDEGFSTYLRQYFKAQELPTDEAICAWDDGNLRDYHDQDWDADNEFVRAMYNRIYYQISLCNEFIRNTTASSVSSRGFTTEQQALIAEYNSEARLVRNLSYYHVIDLFGAAPFVDENSPVGSVKPEQKSRTELFDFLVKDLVALEPNLKEPTTNIYGRIDKAAAWMLLAKLYLNAEVYIGSDTYDGQNVYTKAIEYSTKIIGSKYELHSQYDQLFMADNHKAKGIIFPVLFDGQNSQTWGGMTYIINAALNEEINPDSKYGVKGGWGGNRITPQFYDKVKADARAMFITDGHTKSISDITKFEQGYAVAKFKNITSDGKKGSNETYPDTDFPMFRIAEAYLTAAEAFKRGGAGIDESTAVGYINELRQRANGNTSDNISAGDLTLDFLLDERAKEFYWECHRRTDLVRFGKLTGGDYIWEWKGAIQDGQSTESKFDLMPIPSSDVNANPNIDQNPNYK